MGKVHIIDCDTYSSYVPDFYGLEEHKKGGQLIWDPSKIRLHLSDNQRDGKAIQGHKLREELANQFVLNINVMDYLLAHPELIPEEWKGQNVHFWGTIYHFRVLNRIFGDSLYVYSLLFDGKRWRDFNRSLVCDWESHHPAAIFTP